MALVTRRAIRSLRDVRSFGEPDGEPSDPWFNPYRLPATERAHEVVREVAGQLQALSRRYHSLRQRKRRPDDQQRFEAIVAAVIADLIHHHLSGSPGNGLVVTRSKNVLARQSRYRPAIFTEAFVTVLDLLAAPEMDFLVQQKGKWSPQRACIARPSGLVHG